MNIPGFYISWYKQKPGHRPKERHFLDLSGLFGSIGTFLLDIDFAFRKLNFMQVFCQVLVGKKYLAFHFYLSSRTTIHNLNNSLTNLQI